MLRILISTNTRFYGDGLALLFEREGEFDVVAVTRGGDALPADVDAYAPDVILVDLTDAAAVDAVRAIRVPAVALAVADVPVEVIACAEAGFAGFVTRDCSFDELLDVVRSAARGELLCSPAAAAALLRRVALNAVGGPQRATRVRPPVLTSREAEIVDLIERGFSNKQIGTHLSIEVATVKNHVHNILEKLDVKRRGEAVAQVRAATAAARDQHTYP